MTRDLARRGAVLAAATAVLGILIGFLAARESPSFATWLWVSALVGAFALALGFLLFLPASRALRSISRAADRVAEGDFAQRITTATGSTTELAASFNNMADRVTQLFNATAAEQARIEALFNASTDPMVAIAPDMTIQFLNSAAVVLFDRSHDQAVGRPLIESARDYELDDLARAALRSHAASGTAVISFGQQRTPLRALAVPIPAGGDWAVLLVLTDLTEVQRVDQIRRDFVSNVSHELRTPLASIRALVETLEDGATEPGAETADFLHRIHQQVNRLTTLVNELLDLSRIESGAIELHPEQVPLGELVAEAAALLRPRADAESITIETPQGPGPLAEVDRPSILRVVTNLLDNAIKYSPPGGRIAVPLADEGELVAIAVADDGPGVAAQDLPRVFERFYKGDPSRHGSGVGLGLAIVKHLVRAHGGTATAESAPGSGAIFTVRLPRRFVGRQPSTIR